MRLIWPFLRIDVAVFAAMLVVVLSDARQWANVVVDLYNLLR